MLTAPLPKPGAAIANALLDSGTSVAQHARAIWSIWCCGVLERAPSGARRLTRMFERSSSGASSLGSSAPAERDDAPTASSATGSASQRRARKAREGRAVAAASASKKALASRGRRAVAACGREQEAAHHRRERQRDERRDEHRARHDDAELAEQAAGQPLQEDDRQEHGGERRRVVEITAK